MKESIPQHMAEQNILGSCTLRWRLGCGEDWALKALVEARGWGEMG